MKIWTQADIDAVELNGFGRRDFPGGCLFDKGCRFAEGSHFARGGRFAEDCYFARGCSFAEDCSFGERCSFADECCFEGHKCKPGNPFIAVDRCGSQERKTYFFNFTDGIYVRAGCFFGTLEVFRARVLDDCNNDKTTPKALQYLGFANIAAATFK